MCIRDSLIINVSGIKIEKIKSLLEKFKSLNYDELIIQIGIEKLPKASLEFNYKVLNQNKDLICEGHTKIAFLNSSSYKPIRCPDFIYRLFI